MAVRKTTASPMLGGREFLEALCRVMGVDENNVLGVDIHAEWKERVEITFHMIARESMLSAFDDPASDSEDTQHGSP